MRLTGGQMRGRKVCTSNVGQGSAHGILRPTSSKVREALFNIIAPRIDGAKFLDLFTGTGTMGTEAMSRGAEKVYFVDADRSRTASVSEMLDGCGCQPKSSIVCMDALEFIKTTDQVFDIVFLDPPYQSALATDALRLIDTCLAVDGLVIVEHGRKLSLQKQYGVLHKHKDYRYGDTMLTLFMRAD